MLRVSRFADDSLTLTGGLVPNGGSISVKVLATLGGKAGAAARVMLNPRILNSPAQSHHDVELKIPEVSLHALSRSAFKDFADKL